MKAPSERLQDRAQQGDADAFQQLLDVHRTLLEKLISSRMDLRLRARFVPSEIVQAILVEGLHRRADYFSGGNIPIYVWLRKIAMQQLECLHRNHLLTAPDAPEPFQAERDESS